MKVVKYILKPSRSGFKEEFIPLKPKKMRVNSSDIRCNNNKNNKIEPNNTNNNNNNKEESSRLEETYCHSKFSGKPLAYVNVKNTQGVK